MDKQFIIPQPDYGHSGGKAHFKKRRAKPDNRTVNDPDILAHGFDCIQRWVSLISLFMGSTIIKGVKFPPDLPPVTEESISSSPSSEEHVNESPSKEA